MRRNTRLESSGIPFITALDDLSHLVQPGDHSRLLMGHGKLKKLTKRPQLASRLSEQFGDSFTGGRRNGDRVWFPLEKSAKSVFVTIKAVGLVKDHERRFSCRANFVQNSIYRLDLFGYLRVTCVHDMQQQ